MISEFGLKELLTKGGDMKVKLLIMIVVCLFMIIGCSTFGSYGPRIECKNLKLETVEGNNNYKVLEPTTGKATQSTILFGIFSFGDNGYRFGVPGYQTYLEIPGAKDYAVYQALEKEPDADFLLTPRFQVTVLDLLIYSEVNVKAIGSGIQIVEKETPKQ
jgi:hypothetical protein